MAAFPDRSSYCATCGAQPSDVLHASEVHDVCPTCLRFHLDHPPPLDELVLELPAARACRECAYTEPAISRWSPDPRFCLSCWQNGYGHGLAGCAVRLLSEFARNATYPDSVLRLARRELLGTLCRQRARVEHECAVLLDFFLEHPEPLHLPPYELAFLG